MRTMWYKHFILPMAFLLTIAGLAIGNDYYTHGGYPATGSAGSSALMRAELDSITAGFDKLPTFASNANKAVVINGGATGMTVTTGTLALAGNFATTGAFNTTIAQSASTTFTLPGVSGTAATLAGTETLTNKTLTSPVLAGTPTGSWTSPAFTTPAFTGLATGSFSFPAHAVTGALDLSGASAGQIVFPASQNASAGANTLDDYEEGTWTPAITFDTPGNLVVAYTSQQGHYTKIGRRIHATYFLNTSTFTHTTASGNLRITGLPFTALTDSGFAWIGYFTPHSSTTIVMANRTQFNTFITNNTNFLNVYGTAQAQAPLAMDTTHHTTGTGFISFGDVTYEAAN